MNECGLCGTKFITQECTLCGLSPTDNPFVHTLNFGKYRGRHIEYVYEHYPTYLQWMLSHNEGTAAQRAMARILLSGRAVVSLPRFAGLNQLPPNTPPLTGSLYKGSQNNHYREELGTSSKAVNILYPNQSSVRATSKIKTELEKPKVRWYHWLGSILIVVILLVGLISWNEQVKADSKTKAFSLSTRGALTYPTAECVIKGNMSDEKIYHIPGQKYYDITSIDPVRGGRWFCTEQDALNNGWRKSKV